MEKKKQEKTMMSLMFPFIELGKGVQPYEASSYEESGSYFVKDSQGVFHIIEVSKEDRFVNGWCLHNNMASQLSYQLAVCPLTETMLRTEARRLPLPQLKEREMKQEGSPRI